MGLLARMSLSIAFLTEVQSEGLKVHKEISNGLTALGIDGPVVQVRLAQPGTAAPAHVQKILAPSRRRPMESLLTPGVPGRDLRLVCTCVEEKRKEMKIGLKFK